HDEGWILAVAYSPDGGRIASGSRDGIIRVWEARTRKILLSLAGHAGGVRSLAFSPDGIHLVSGGTDKKVKLWNLVRGTTSFVLSHHSEIRAVACSPDGRYFAAAGGDPGP